MVIILIGMPGCGKTCMGKALGRKLKLKVIDGDALIEKKYERKLHEIIEEHGLEEFKRIEEEILLSISGDDIVISTGGSAIYYDSVMQYFKSIGTVVYLDVNLKILKQRLGDFSKRGVVLQNGQTLDELYRERTELYKKYADVTVNCSGNAFPRYQQEVIDAVTKK